MNRLPLRARVLSECFRSKSLDPVAVVEHSLAQIECHKHLNAFVRVSSEKALEQAKQSKDRHDANSPKSVLDGVTIAVKDNFCTKGIHTTCASR